MKELLKITLRYFFTTGLVLIFTINFGVFKPTDGRLDLNFFKFLLLLSFLAGIVEYLSKKIVPKFQV